MARWTTQSFSTINDTFDNMNARNVRLEIEDENDDIDPNAGVFRLRCIDADVNANAPLDLGQYESLTEAQDRADELMTDNRQAPPKLVWTRED
jgi:hypothetical protein